MNTTIINTLLAGSVKPLAGTSHQSGIDKRPLHGAAWLGKNGITGDAHGDVNRHGGPEKALHHYAFDHYDFWLHEIGSKDILFNPGAFGENMSSIGLTEKSICIGDIFTLGETIVQVTQARQPCWRLNHRFEHSNMSALVQKSMRTGWYYRVLKVGWISAGCELRLVQRDYPQWPLARLLQLLYERVLDYDELSAASKIKELPESWRKIIEGRIRRKSVEDWGPRLFGSIH